MIVLKSAIPFLVFFFCFISSKAQPVYLQGSYVIVAKAKDGIMMASDSRCAFPYRDENGNSITLGYTDNFQKIYVVGKNAIALAGTFSIGNLLVSTMIEEFSKLNDVSQLDISNLLPTFFEFSKKHYSRWFYEKLLAESTLFAAGIDKDNNAHVYVYTVTFGKVAEQMGTPPVAETPYSDFTLYFKQEMTCKESGEIAARSIRDYAKKKLLQNKIGGDIIIAKVTSRGVEFISNPPAKMRYHYLSDIIKEIYDGTVKPVFTSESNKQIFYKVFKKDQ